ncbi:Probable Co/Zn/Cd efflux system membrane fusion protein [hydrothermal vent metagenome]|uniref:Probable Co/Zn/Cd efflux system membrane fusion protein n=1 Tax=hydrothermal vent metagenome TaxID=652676 RepID=A0A3B0WG53_9ZZZZ
MLKQTLSTGVWVLATLFFLNGCEEPPQAFVAPSRPVKTIVIGEASSGDSRTFPAVVDAIQKADISFRVSGKIQKVLVKEGDNVIKGQLLAELDPTDFKIKLKDRQASFDTAKANYNRAKALVDKGVISRVDHDKIRADFYTAQSGLDEAKQDLIYTKLKANFAGQIAKRHVENFEEVLGSQKVFSLEDVSALKLKIDVPENLMIAVDKNRGNDRDLYAKFDKIKNEKFPLKFSEASTKADPNTKTFKITLTMNASKDYNILPGMTATVVAELFPTETSSTTAIAVPVSAVIANSKKQATVWVVDEKTMTANPQKVTPGLMVGDVMQVEGLTPGDRIVVAGAAFLRNNMKVTLLKTGEQAQ